MGMAASQARFLGLTARKSNLEYEGQQINQQRTALSNQSANYYNNLLGMAVPTPPSVDDYTQTVYSFEDGALSNTITALIANTNGTYTVSYLRSWVDDFSPVSAATSVVTKSGGGYYVGDQSLRPLGSVPGGTTIASSINIDGTTYAVNHDGGGYYIDESQPVTKEVACTSSEIANFHYFTFDADYNPTYYYKDTSTNSFYILDDNGNRTDTSLTDDDMFIVLFDMNDPDPETATTFVTKKNSTTYVKTVDAVETTKRYLTSSELQSIEIPTDASNYSYFQNLTADQIKNALAEEQAWARLLEQKYGTPANAWFVRYVQDSSTGEYIPYFYKQSDVIGATYSSTGSSLSNIPCYTIGSEQKQEEVKAVANCKVEKDSSGRYISISIPDANGQLITYALTTNTTTDNAAYEDAMNQYEYEKYQYDQAIDEINAKIEIVQAEDKNLELRLKQLDTEQDAISTEMDAVSKVIEKNVESSFKTFG